MSAPMPPLMIFAAGFGTRMGALTRHCPKPLLAVDGKTLLDRAIGLGREAGAPKILANAHYLHDQITAHLAPQSIPVSVEEDAILDTGGGLKAALPLLGAPARVATLNPDVVWTGPNPLRTLAEAWRDDMGALLLTLPMGRTISGTANGDFSMDADGRLSRGGDLRYTGAQIIAPRVLAQIPDAVFSLNVAWDLIAEAGGLYGVEHPGGWCDVGSPEGITAAEDMLQRAELADA